MMSVRSSTVFVSLVLLLGAIDASSFNPDSYKPYQWNWEAQTKDFHNKRRLPCPTKYFRPCICKSDLKKSTFLVDCDGTLTTGKIYRLQAPHNATHLRVRKSKIVTIPSGSFDQVKHLIYLDLSSNYLEKIESQAFAGLDSLRVLDLSNNALRSSAVFLRPLSSLQVLNVCCQFKDDFVFMDSIVDLKQLEKLAFSTSFLSKDKVLKLQNTSVTYLSVSAWQLALLEIQRGALFTWTTLKSLELKYQTNLGIRSNDVFKNLCGLHVENLYIESGLSGFIFPFHFKAPNMQAFAMSKTDVKKYLFLFADLQSVQWLDISSNRLEYIYFPFMYRLRHVDISNQMPLTDICMRPIRFFVENPVPNSLISIDFSGTKTCFLTITYLLHLKFVNLRNTDLAKVLTGQWLVCQTNEVTISHLDLQDNNIQYIKPTFFNSCDWSALNVLKLSNNRLDLGESNTCGYIQPAHFMDFLKPLWNLTDLYLSRNSVENDFPPNMLNNQTQLRSLHLSDMSLTNLTFEIRHMKDLNFLDISHNRIHCFYPSTLRDINTIIHYTPPKTNVSRSLVLNLSHNSLQCNCACLQFYQWMQNVRPYITFVDFDSYQCTFDNGKSTNMSDLTLIVNILQSQCVSTDWTPVTTTTTTIVTVYMFILLATTLFRIRHTLRYIWLRHRMHKLYLERHLLDIKYRFDAFVSCDRTDAIWVKRNFLPKLENKQTELKFCVAQRDFIVGATIIDNIVRSINQSRKVVCIISQNFLKSGWCKEELLLGHHESLSRGKNLLICIFMPDIIYNKLPDRFRFILNHVTCVKWPRDPAAQQVFWIMLQRALLDGKETNAANEFVGN